jgi:hypothetical protein
LHREGDKPAIIIDKDGTHIEKYYHAGLMHRIGGAAFTRTGEFGDITEHRIHGKLISPDNNTPSQKIVNYHDYEGVRNGEMFHNKLGQEHRDGDLPSKDYTIKNRNDVTTHVVEYKKNGEILNFILTEELLNNIKKYEDDTNFHNMRIVNKTNQ